MTAFAIAISVSWAAVRVLVGVSVVTTTLYNFDIGGMKSFADDVGDKIYNGLKAIGYALSNTWDSLK